MGETVDLRIDSPRVIDVSSNSCNPNTEPSVARAEGEKGVPVHHDASGAPATPASEHESSDSSSDSAITKLKKEHEAVIRRHTNGFHVLSLLSVGSLAGAAAAFCILSDTQRELADAQSTRDRCIIKLGEKRTELEDAYTERAATQAQLATAQENVDAGTLDAVRNAEMLGFCRLRQGQIRKWGTRAEICTSTTVPNDANCSAVDVNAAGSQTTCEATDDTAGTPAKCRFIGGTKLPDSTDVTIRAGRIELFTEPTPSVMFCKKGGPFYETNRTPGKERFPLTCSEAQRTKSRPLAQRLEGDKRKAIKRQGNLKRYGRLGKRKQ